MLMREAIQAGRPVLSKLRMKQKRHRWKTEVGDFLFLFDEMIDMGSYHSGDDHNYSDILLLEVYIFKPPNQYGDEI